jgi:hypothetical protein
MDIIGTNRYINAKITQILSSGVTEDSRETYSQRAENLLSFEMEKGITLKNVIEFYYKENKKYVCAVKCIKCGAAYFFTEKEWNSMKQSEFVCECMKKTDEEEDNIHYHCEWCNQAIYRKNGGYIYHPVNGKDYYFCGDVCREHVYR